jgi:hypothetical protein
VLSSIKTGDCQPGSGFFELVEPLGRDISDRDACWLEEFETIKAIGNAKTSAAPYTDAPIPS